jgi:hypothetical protein
MRFANMALDGGNYINAAMNSGGAMENILSKNTPDYGKISKTAGRAKTNEEISSMQAMANVQNAGISSLANTKASAFNAQATIAQGEANADAIQAEGMSSMIGSIGGGLMGAFKPKTSKTSFGSLGPSNFDLNKNFW